MTGQRMGTGRPRWLGWALLAGVIAAVALVSVLMRPDDVGEPQPAPGPEREEPHPPADPAWTVASADFADADIGFALQRRCSSNGCPTVLLMTDTDGSTDGWAAATVALGFDSIEQGARVLALGDCRAVVEHLGDHETPGIDPRRWYTGNCGRSWTKIGMQPFEGVAAIPDGGILESVCPNGTPDINACDAQLAVTLSDSGSRARLWSQPKLTKLVAEPHPIGAGTWLVQGRDRATGNPAVAVSHNDGRTWRTTVLAKPRGFGPDDLLYLTNRGKDVYAVASGTRAMHRRGLQAVYHSGDQGRTWERTRWSTGRGPIEGIPMATSYGLLLIGDDKPDRRFWLSFDHGRTFNRAGWDLPGDWPVRTRGGYLVHGPETELPSRWYRSADGVTWQEITFPTS